MNKLVSGLLAATMAGSMAMSAAPAQAQNFSLSIGQRDAVIERYCDRYPRSRDCRRFYDDDWDDRDYSGFYLRNRRGLDSIATGLFGFTFGAIVGSAIANSRDDDDDGFYISDYDEHVERCYARFRSYDEETDTYLGYDGDRHRCRL